MKKLFIILIILILNNVPAYPQPYTIWVKNYGDLNFNRFASVTAVSDSGIAAIGRFQTGEFFNIDMDTWVVRTNEWGDTLWTKLVGNIWLTFDTGAMIRETSDGGLILTGHNGFPGGDIDIRLVKLDSRGNIEWDKFIGGDGTQSGKALDVTQDGGFIISAFSPDSNDVNNVLVVKTDGQGDTLWTRMLGGNEDDWMDSITETADGGYILTGNTRSFNNDSLSGRDLWLVRLDQSGDLLWMKSFHYMGEELGRSVIETNDGGFMIGGTISARPSINNQALLLKTDANGDTLWTRTYGGINNEQAMSVLQVEDGGFIFGGFTTSSPLNNEGNVWIVRTDSIGDTLWTKKVHKSLKDEGNEIVEFRGGYVISGLSRFDKIEFPHTHTDGLLIRIGEALSRLAVRDLTAGEDDLIEVPIIFNYPLELSFNAVDISISGYGQYLTFLGINGTGAAVGESGWSFEETISDSSFSASFSGETSLSAMDTLFYADFIVKEFTEELITIRIDSAEIDSGAIPLEIFAGHVKLLRSVGVDDEKTSLPDQYSLEQNYPNPFNPVTKIEFNLPISGKTTLLIYNLLGQEVARLVDESLEAGRYSYDWNASKLSSGIYIYKLSSNEFTRSRKMVLLK